MTAASPGPGPNIFSLFSDERRDLYRTRRETFVFSIIGQAVIVALLVYFTGYVVGGGRGRAPRIPDFRELPIVFSGFNGGGGGNHDPVPASHGDLPRASLDP
ncbi:MAG: hypothetical protein DMG79_19335, partial [Acidobacteria bacterium]